MRRHLEERHPSWRSLLSGSSISKEMIAFAKEIKITDVEEAKLGIPTQHHDNWSAVSSQIYDARRMNCLPVVGADLRGQSPVQLRQRR